MNARISEPAANRGLRVLVVEDEPDALAATLSLLEALGHSGGGLSNAELALDRFMDGAFDVIITDVGLPGLSGRDLAEILGGVADVPIIFATGQPAPSILPPRRVWLRKPFTLEQMSDALARAVATNLPAPAPSSQPSLGPESPGYGSLRAA
ncbi:response regulator [Variovorax sp. OV329]|uniref:response regulator n=1 Tax=Variovorax sp. OV329 TaxID=1882825 RepID=UPI0008E28D1D|nr:response regulator [Variovorax sp. OV329]SFM58609.1 Response regulator receiver domain-containing protein [Variovorax sp. OV329]